MSKSNTDLWQNIGTTLALVISSLALFVSIYEANIMKAQQKAMIWPYFQVSEYYNAEGFSIKAYNNGTGPAIIKSVQIDYNDVPLANLTELLDSLNPDRTFDFDIVKNNSINNYVFRAGEERLLFGFPWTEETREAVKNVKNLRMRVQYESVLGDKWLYDTEYGRHEQRFFLAKKEFKN